MKLGTLNVNAFFKRDAHNQIDIISRKDEHLPITVQNDILYSIWLDVWNSRLLYTPCNGQFFMDGSHIQKLWGISDLVKRVYPPCDTFGLQVLPLERSTSPPKIIYVSQFRPEKARPYQLEAFAIVLKNLNSDLPSPKLQFVGSCRNAANERRLLRLKDRARELNVESDVEFHRNATYSELMRLLGGAYVGIHSMIDEHFGICVVEYMASGATPIAHNSAGPMMDIVLPEGGKQTGYLVQDVQEYADAILKILRMPESERLEMAAAARKRALRFSEQHFYEDFKDAIRPIFLHTR